MVEPKRRWWRKKRWWFTITLWLLIAYPLSVGPVLYSYRRGWCSPGVYVAYKWPASFVYLETYHVAPEAWDATWERYILWWLERADADYVRAEQGGRR